MFHHLLRFIFPAWNFFDEVADPLTVSYRWADQDIWQSLDLKPARPDHFFFKPQENYYLYMTSTLIKFVQQLPDLKDASEVESLASYRFLEKAIAGRIDSCEKKYFIFRIGNPELIFQSNPVLCSRS